MKLGIKLWSRDHEQYLEAIELIGTGDADYLELTYLSGQESHLDVLKKKKVPVIIHAPSSAQGFCLSDANFDRNRLMMKEVIKAADYLKADKIIIHPDAGQVRNFIKFLKEQNDDRIFIENMPKKGINSESMIGYSPVEIKEFLSIGSFGFCLDFPHAIKAAVSQGIDYKEYLKELIAINPGMFHVSDGTLSSEIDEHLNIGEGEFDFSFIKDLIVKNESLAGKSKEVTFEVPKINSLKNAIVNIKKFKAIK